MLEFSPRTPVLIVDDDRDIRALTRLALEDAGYPVYEAAEGAAALRVLRASASPLVTLLDLWMPEMDGQQVLAAVVADEMLRQRHAYLLMTATSAAGLPAPLLALLTQLRVPVLAKPFAVDALVHMVAQATARLPSADAPSADTPRPDTLPAVRPRPHAVD